VDWGRVPQGRGSDQTRDRLQLRFLISLLPMTFPARFGNICIASVSLSCCFAAIGGPVLFFLF
jgi:hypothetical protein